MNASESRALVTAVDRVAGGLGKVGEHAWLRNPDYRFHFVNEPFARLLDLPLAEIESRSDHELFGPDDARYFRLGDRHCTRIVGPVFIEETDSISHDLVDTLKAPVVLPSGRVAGVAGIVCRFPGAVASGEPPVWLRRGKRLLAARFTEATSIARLARALRVHRDSFARCFKRHYGIGIHAYVRTLRVQWCSWALLERPDRGLGELAAAAGFADQSHMTREFRRIRGMTPGRLRRRWHDAGAEPASRFRITAGAGDERRTSNPLRTPGGGVLLLER